MDTWAATQRACSWAATQRACSSAISQCITSMLRTLRAPASFVGRYPSDDINKFLWMVRIGGGEFPEIKERDYIGDGSYRVDNKVTKVRRHSCASSKVRSRRHYACQV